MLGKNFAYISRGVIEIESGNRQASATSHIKAMDWPVLDVQVLDDTIYHLVQNDEMIRSIEKLERYEVFLEGSQLTWQLHRCYLVHPSKLVHCRQ
jgi:hypothetical protein